MLLLFGLTQGADDVTASPLVCLAAEDTAASPSRLLEARCAWPLPCAEPVQDLCASAWAVAGEVIAEPTASGWDAPAGNPVDWEVCACAF